MDVEPISIRFDFVGKNLDPFLKGSLRLALALDDALKLVGTDVRNIIVKKLDKGSRSGRLYKGGEHQAAAAGEPPKTDTSRLVNSIRADYSFLTADIGSDVIYAIFQEQGAKTRGDTMMPAHPFLQPSLEEADPIIERRFNNALKQAFGI